MARRKRKGKTKSRAKKKPIAKVERRNPVAQAAILRKGGAHQRSRSTERQKQKKSLRKAVADYGGSRQRKSWREDKQKGLLADFFAYPLSIAI